MSPPAPTWQVKRKDCTETSVRLNRQHEFGQILDLLTAAAAHQHSETKRLIFIKGDAGVGKSWFLCDLTARLKENAPDWRILPAFAADKFVNQNPYAHFITLMNACAGRTLLDLNQLSVVTQQDVQKCAESLQLELLNRTHEPLLLVFDELEWWVDITEEQRNYLNTLFRMVWRVLLRQFTMPCVIICAGRRPPEFKDVLLKRTLHTTQLDGLPVNELYKLILPEIRDRIQATLQVQAAGNPWVAQLLNEVYTKSPDVFADSTAKEQVRRWIFDQVVDERLEPTLRQTLYDLAKLRREGFYSEDDLLTEGDATIYRLVRTAFVEFDPDSRRYHVAQVLSSLFKEPPL